MDELYRSHSLINIKGNNVIQYLFFNWMLFFYSENKKNNYLKILKLKFN